MNSKQILESITQEDTNFGGHITLWDNELTPEAGAMVQSLDSRSAGGFLKNLQTVLKEGFQSFMKKFYSGYGHKSIADCGSTSGAIDNISMLAAKELQNWQLYNGQETSTRYINVTELGYVDPVGTEISNTIMKKWFEFYKKALPLTISYLKTVHPKKDDEENDKYESMIEKRAYDILGSFLPAGARTNATYHMTLRQLDDKLAYTVHHPLEEISDLGTSILNGLKKRYPGTFVKKRIYEESEEYRKNFQNLFAYVMPDQRTENFVCNATKGNNVYKNFLHETILLHEYEQILQNRPEKTEVPKIINECGSYRIEFLIDFRSHRDLQRQRSALQRVPLLTTKYGFEEWYLDQLPGDLRKEAEILLEEQAELINNLPCEKVVKQYYIPMGYKVFDVFTIGLADLIYIIELRTSITVHPTVRKIVQQWNGAVKTDLPKFVTIYANMSEDQLTITRADQDIFIDGKSFNKTQ